MLLPHRLQDEANMETLVRTMRKTKVGLDRSQLTTHPLCSYYYSCNTTMLLQLLVSCMRGDTAYGILREVRSGQAGGRRTEHGPEDKHPEVLEVP